MKFNLKTILFSLAVAAMAPITTAQNPSAHVQAHKQYKHHIAKATTATDRARLAGAIEEDIKAHENLHGLSNESSAMIDDLLKEAHTHIGKRYVHGSKGPKAFDCSGFSSYVYKQFGYKISPASRMQYTVGVPVGLNELRKGDLVFFTSRSSGRNVGHVGIVVSADNESGKFKFIHASVKGVRINENEGYYKSRYVGARRIITK